MATERQLALTLLGLLLLVQVELAASSSSGQDPVRVIAWDSQILVRGYRSPFFLLSCIN